MSMGLEDSSTEVATFEPTQVLTGDWTVKFEMEELVVSRLKNTYSVSDV